MKNKLIVLISLPLLLGSCDSGTVYENGEYRISWIDSKKNQALRFKNEGIISECVAKLGENDQFIIVERIDLDKAEPVYYIIDKNAHKSTWNKPKLEGIIGPLTLNEFEKEKKKLNVPTNLDFTIKSENCQ